MTFKFIKLRKCSIFFRLFSWIVEYSCINGEVKFQVAIVPCGITVNLKDEERSGLYAACEEYEKELVAAGVRVKGDYRENYSPGWKFNHWELKGVPLRVEVGPRDVKSGQFVAVRRDTGEKVTLNKADCVKDIKKLLDDVQASLFAR